MGPPSDLLERANAGDAEAQCDVGRFFMDNDGDPLEAINWFKAAARQDLPRAHHNLGVMAFHDDRLEDAKKSFLIAAEAGWINSQVVLGHLLLEEHDLDGAGHYFKLAAQAGDIEAMDGLAEVQFCRDSAEGYREALTLSKAVAEKGVLSALLRLAVIYHEGLGVDRDSRRAVQYWRSAAERGSAAGKAMYGISLEMGQFVERDIEESAFLLAMAAQEDHLAGRSYLPRVIDQLNALQFAKLNERLKAAGYQRVEPLPGGLARLWRVWGKRPLTRLRFNYLAWTGQGHKLVPRPAARKDQSS